VCSLLLTSLLDVKQDDSLLLTSLLDVKKDDSLLLVGLRIYNIFLLVLEDIVYSPEDFCLANGILSVLFMFCYTYMFHCIQKP
jgi:hypothetical protein